MTTSSVAKVKAFPSNTIAIMVHKHFVERVQEYLLLPLHHQIPWKTLHHVSGDSLLPTTEHNNDANNHGPDFNNESDNHDQPLTTTTATTTTCSTSHPNVTLLDTTETTGMSHDRRGYLALLLEATLYPIHKISPMARQNIAWAFKIDHMIYLQKGTTKINGNRCFVDDVPNKNNGDNSHAAVSGPPPVDRKIMDEIASRIVDTLPADSVPLLYNPQKDILRVDVYPKSYTDDICLGLQRAWNERAPQSPSIPPPEVPYEGPIAMTRSASKCSHRLAIIISTRNRQDSNSQLEDGNNSSNKATEESSNNNDIDYNHDHDQHACTEDYICCCWGWMDRRQESDQHIMEARLNDVATNEINAIPPTFMTGKKKSVPVVEEETKNNVPFDTPLSRAYYKLDQVWDEILQRQEQTTLASIQQQNASAVDFGSSPGGWTQVLAQRATGLKAICSVDRGKLGDRATKLPRVHHIHGLIEDCQTTIEPFGPFGIVVCDASQLWSEIMDIFIKTVVVIEASLLPEVNAAGKFTLPCIFVITMKLPYQTPQSVQRHIQMIHERLPKYLSDMALAMYSRNQIHVNDHSDNGDGSVSGLRRPKIQSRYILVHRMANSPSERTLIAIFEESPKTE